MKKQRFVSFILVLCIVILSLCFVSCKQNIDEIKSIETVANNIKTKEFNTNPKISETTLVDNDDVVIIAKELTYSSYSADLKISIQNKSDREKTILANTNAYSANIINNINVCDGYLSVDVKPSETVDETISFSLQGLKFNGIYEIAKMFIGFAVKDEDYTLDDRKEDNILSNELDTDIASSFDNSKNLYEENINNGCFEVESNSKLINHVEKINFNDDNVSIISSSVFSTEDEKIVAIDLFNKSNKYLSISIRNPKIDGVLAYDGLWSYDSLPGGVYTISTTSLSQMTKDTDIDLNGSKELEMEVSISGEYGEKANKQTITISLV